MPAEPAVSVQHLVKSYGSRRAVDDLSFDVRRGEIFALLGPNGAGKTTTVEILEGYRRPDGGTVRVLGLDPVREGRALKPRMGLMLQQGGIYPQVRPLEALELFASFYARAEEPRALLALVGLEHCAGTRYRQLSGGEKQRLALALALVGRPEIAFLDEPTTGMDPQARRLTWRLIAGLKERGTTVVLTTHFMEEAERLADRVAIINRGRLVALGRHEELASASAGGEIRFTATPGLDTGALAARLGARAACEIDDGRYLVEAGATPALVAALTAFLAERNALLTELSVARPSLEELYLRLTGDTEALKEP
jgi:ABC-2 type transport system ATP-binding protein